MARLVLLASPAPRTVTAAMQKTLSSSRVTLVSPPSQPPRIFTLTKQSTFLVERRERCRTEIASLPSSATSVALTQTLAMANVFHTMAIRTRRIEDPAQRRAAEVVKLPAAPRTTALAASKPAAPTQPPHRLDEVVETVHVAPWLKPASPPANIDQIADQVIRQIDSRVIAWRERMGRI